MARRGRPIDRLLFPEIFGPHFIDLLYNDDDDEDDVGRLARRPYNLPVRATINSWDDVEFFDRFRLTKQTFLYVLQLVGPALEHPQPRSRYVTPEQQLLITLRFLASGNMQITVADVVRVSQPTVSRILPKVCMALIAHFHTFIKMPETDEERAHVARQFFGFRGLPRIIGAIDCTHIKIDSPGGRLVREPVFHFIFWVVCIKIQNL